jgi:hypothetical protein
MMNQITTPFYEKRALNIHLIIRLLVSDVGLLKIILHVFIFVPLAMRKD